MNTQGRRQKAKGESRKAEGSIHDPRPTTHAVPEVLNEGRRKFMLGAAGFTFGIVAGVPVLLRPEETRAQSAKSVAVNAWVTLYTDGTVAIMSPAAEMGQGSLTALPIIDRKSVV